MNVPNDRNSILAHGSLVFCLGGLSRSTWKKAGKSVQCTVCQFYLNKKCHQKVQIAVKMSAILMILNRKLKMIKVDWRRRCHC
ncbi:unnamed protein product [Pieris brassicae]|uniref:Uncharacterized protein n=1 Tax=Pieris brassicae TaxID=7116 RepID=A0A9P0TPL8_PIEBR|nr:unnamed protein product [Pieris brassicae]